MYDTIKILFKCKLEKVLNSYIEKYIKDNFEQCLASGKFNQHIKEVLLNQHLIFGDYARLKLSPKSIVNNALFNLSSGEIIVEDNVFFGHNVSLITGTHNYTKFGLERMDDYPTEGNNIVIEEGVWIASNVTVLAPCKIGKHSVVAAGAVVRSDVPSYHVVAGIPATTIKEIQH